MDYQAIIDKYYPADNELRRVLLQHSRQVADRCLTIARKHRELPVDVQFLEDKSLKKPVVCRKTFIFAPL